MGIAGMVLGILATVFVWLPILGLIAIPIAVVGLPLSIAGLIKGRRRNTGTGTAIAGVLTNTFAMAVALLRQSFIDHFWRWLVWQAAMPPY